jgi:two-component system alkaline phosphatase synthesis response regulator PhoP
MSDLDRIRCVIVGASTDLQSRLTARAPELTVVTLDVTTDIVDVVNAARPDIVVLTRTVGGRSAMWLCQSLKQRPGSDRIPVLFVGFGDDATAESAAFSAGADDYVARNGTAATMVARLRAILRRFGFREIAKRSLEAEPMLQIGEIDIQPHSYAASVGGKVIPLTAGEFRILWKLACGVGKTFSASELLPLSIDPSGPTAERSVRSHICMLRRKLGRAGAQIQTVRNAGYRLIGENQ